MRPFLVKLLLFCGILLLINTALYLVINAHYYSPYEKRADARFHTLLLSDSHGAFLEDRLERFGVYNFSIPSDSYVDLLRKLNFMLETGGDVRRIILSAEEHNLSPYREGLNNGDRSLYYLPLLRPDPTSGNPYTILKDKYVSRYLVFVNSKARDFAKSYLPSVFKPRRMLETDKSWADLNVKDKDTRSKSRVEQQFPGSQPSQEMESALQSIFELAKRRNISVIGVKFPLTQSYLSYSQNKTYGVADIFARNGAEVLDFRGIYADRDSLFADEDHLNSRGADVFSSVLALELEKRGFIGDSTASLLGHHSR